MWTSFCANSSLPRRPSPSDAGSTTSVRCRSNASSADRAAVRRRAQPGHDLGDGRVAGCRGPLALGQRVADRDPRCRPTGRSPSRCGGGRPAGRRSPSSVSGGVEHRGDALEAARDRRQPLGQRRELAGDQREQPVAEHVDPLERAPACPRGAPSRRSGARRARRAGGRDRPARRSRARRRRGPRTRASSDRRSSSRAARPAAVIVGHSASWACIPAEVAVSGWRAKYSPRNASTRAAKSDTGWTPDRGLGVESTGRDPTPPAACRTIAA